jgi:carbamoyltransferase
LLGASYRVVEGDEERADLIAAELEAGRVVGFFSGRLEFGPRSLRGRSILGDARNTEMQTQLNLKIKYRESFRPFAPAVLEERAHDYFDIDTESPYMLLVAPVVEEHGSNSIGTTSTTTTCWPWCDDRAATCRR